MSERRPWWPVVVVFLAMAAFLMSGTAFVLNAVTAKNGPPAAVAAEGSGDAGAGTVAVELTEWEVNTDTTSIPAGRVNLVVTNAGDVPHTVAIEGVDGTETPNLNSGESATISTELPAGTYELVCTIPGHEEAS